MIASCRRTGLVTLALVLLWCVCCLPAMAAPGRLAQVRILGNQEVKTEAIRQAADQALAQSPKDATLQDVAEPVRQAIMKLGYFESVQVVPSAMAGGAGLMVTVKELRRVSKITFVGNALMSSDDLAAAITTKPGLYLNERLLQRDAQRVAEAYAEKGLKASVSDLRVSTAGEVVFTVAEPQISELCVTGLRIVKPEEVAGLVTIKAGGPLLEDKVAESVSALRHTGWFSEVKPRVTPAPDGQTGLVLEFVVSERPGIFPERVGVPMEKIDVARLRSDISPPRLDIQYQASVRLNEYLLDTKEEVPAALTRLEAAAKKIDAAKAGRDEAATLLEYGRALEAADRGTEAKAVLGAAAEVYGRLSQADPKDYGLLLALGEALGSSGKRPEALETLRKACELQPQKWEAHTRFAQTVAGHLYAELGHWMAAQKGPVTTEALRQSAPIRAMVELVPWEKTAAAMRAVCPPGATEEDLVKLGREASQHLAEALRVAPEEPRVRRAEFEAVIGTLFAALGAVGQEESIWAALGAEAEAVAAKVQKLAEADPGVALWSSFVRSTSAVLFLTGAPQVAVSEERINQEFRLLAEALTKITERWPNSLRTTGSLLGIMQFLAGQNEMAKATFEKAVALNPFDRQNYNALLGLAYQAEDWGEMDRLVRRRMAVMPAAEDLIMLGKIADRQGNQEAVGQAFEQAMTQFPQEALGYLAMAGHKLRGGDDETGGKLLEKGLSLAPRSGYAYALCCALNLVEGKTQQAGSALRQSLELDPEDELANLLRYRYFVQ